MQKKVFITREIPEAGISMLREHGIDVDVGGWKTPPSKSELISALGGTKFDAALTILTDEIGAEVMDAAPWVKLYANFAVGVNNIDIKAAAERGITVTNTPGPGSSLCVAEHAIGLMLALSTRLVEGDRYVRAGKYAGWDPMILIGSDLRGKTLGLIGAGHIGSEVARIATRGFGMKVEYYDVARNEPLEKEFGAAYKKTVEEVLRDADFVSIHVPLLDSTHHLINEARLSAMKPSAYLVNTSRGPVIDEEALVRALKDGRLRGAGLDVYENEPALAPGLAELDNAVLTPHIASARESARNEMATIAAENVIAFLEGKTPPNLVKP